MAVNIVNVTSINGKTDAASIASNDSASFAVNTSATDVFKVNTILVSNQADSAGVGGDALVNVIFRDSSVDYNFINDIQVPMKSTLEVLGSSLYVNQNQSIAVQSDSSALNVLVSYESLT